MLYGNLLKDITMIMKTIENYCNVILLYKIEYYKSDQNDCYKFKDEKKERKLVKIN